MSHQFKHFWNTCIHLSQRRFVPYGLHFRKSGPSTALDQISRFWDCKEFLKNYTVIIQMWNVNPVKLKPRCSRITTSILWINGLEDLEDVFLSSLQGVVLQLVLTTNRKDEPRIILEDTLGVCGLSELKTSSQVALRTSLGTTQRLVLQMHQQFTLLTY